MDGFGQMALKSEFVRKAKTMQRNSFVVL